GERNTDAAGLARRQTLAEQKEAPQRHKQRTARLHQQAVDRGGILQRVVGDRVVGREAGEREQRQRAYVLANRRPVTRERERGEGHQNDKRAAPAKTGKRQGRDVSGAQAADNRVDRPEQRAQGQKKIWLIEETGALTPAGISLCLRHQRMSFGRSHAAVDRCLGRTELAWTAAEDQGCRMHGSPPVLPVGCALSAAMSARAGLRSETESSEIAVG